MITFHEMNLPCVLKDQLKSIHFNTPTPIQEKTIPIALEGKDILGSAQTGTGKTGAFGIPLVAKLLSDPQHSALVMTPTRELATQVNKQLNAMLGKKSKILSCLLIGGDPINKQIQNIKKKPRLIVGTPGRICDHLRRKTLKLNHTDFVVLDETDRMLDMGFHIQIKDILDCVPENRQTLLFSATLPENIIRLSKNYLHNPQRIAITSTSQPAKNIDQKHINITQNKKIDELFEQIEQREGSIIVFVKTKYATERIANKIIKKGHKSVAIHGDLKQMKRSRIIEGFHKKKYRILVATDIAARGLDIPHIEHVINYDLPQCPEDYIHRIGRTARAGKKGCALNFISPEDKGKWMAIQKMLDPKLNDKKKFNKNPKKTKKAFFKNKNKKQITKKNQRSGLRSKAALTAETKRRASGVVNE